MNGKRIIVRVLVTLFILVVMSVAGAYLEKSFALLGLPERAAYFVNLGTSLACLGTAGVLIVVVNNRLFKPKGGH